MDPADADLASLHEALVGITGEILAAADVEAILASVAGVLAGRLKVDCVAVLEARDSGRFDLIEGIGFAPMTAMGGDAPGPGSTDAGPFPVSAIGSLAALAASAAASRLPRPVVADDFGQESRFDADALLSAGLAAGVAAAVMVDEVVWGIVAVFQSGSPRHWAATEAESVALCANITGLAIERHRHREARERDRQRDRLAAVGRLAAEVAHDFNNVVVAISLYAELLESRVGADDVGTEYLAAIREQVERATAMVWQMLEFAHRSSLLLADVDLAAFFQQITPLLRLPEAVTLEVVHDGAGYWARADATRVQQILVNLVANASDAIEGPGRIVVRLRRHGVDADAGSPWDNPLRRPSISIEVADTGAGMTAEVAARAFEPFFTTKGADRGTGLGLAQVRSLVEEHEGHVELASVAGEGTTVRTWFPAAERPATGDGDAPPPIPRGSGQGVLVVDDDDAVRAALASVLSWLGYTVTTADSAESASAVLATDHDTIAVLVGEIHRPGAGGETLAEVVAAGWAHLPLILVSGYPPGLSETPSPSDPSPGAVVRLSKPFTTRQLATVMAATLARRDPTARAAAVDQ